jgi:hypothetical protein
MLKIGMDKTDRNFRKFEYDDERMYGNPQMFKVLYEETGGFGEVLCSNVISIKKSTNTHNHFLDIPIYGTAKTEDVSKSKTTVIVSENVVDTKPVVATEGKKKTKTSKSKTKGEILKPGEAAEIKEVSLELNPLVFYPKSYEYDVLAIDNISYTEDVKYKLNELGKDGWEVCGFQMVQKIFGGGAQAIIIMKKGLK